MGENGVRLVPAATFQQGEGFRKCIAAGATFPY